MQQILVTIGPKSQVVIPKNIREVMPELKPGRKVAVRSIDARSVIVEVLPKDWVAQTYGMHKNVWKGVDATYYIHKLRNFSSDFKGIN